jgi:hypothetical protein
MRLALPLAVLLALALLAWYLSFSASRLDRLHHRVEGARSALDAQLVRRAEAAVELAASGWLDPASGLLVAGAAAEALESGETDGGQRERAESDLTRALQVALDDETAAQLRADPVPAGMLTRLGAACHRVRLARRFHNDAVTDACRVRRKRVVRWARLAGYAPEPQTFEMDDASPPALVPRAGRPASGATPGA